MADALATLFLNIRASSADLAIDLRKAESHLQKAGRQFERVGATMTRRFSVPVGLALTGAVREFIAFDAAIVDSISKMDELGIEAARSGSKIRNELERAAIDVAKTTAFEMSETAGAYRFLAEAGFDAQRSIKVLPTVAKFAQAANVDLKRATDLLTDSVFALGGAYEEVFSADGSSKLVKVSGEQMANTMQELSDIMVKVSLESATSVEQSMSAIVTRAGVEARQAGLTMQQVGAAILTLAANGVKAEKAGNQLAVVLRDLKQKASLNADAWEDMGIKVFESGNKMRPLGHIVKAFEERFKGMSLAQREVALSSLKMQLRTRSSFNLFIGMSSQLRKYEEELNNVAGTTDRVVAKQMIRFELQLQQLIERFKEIAISIGRELTPMLLELGHALADLVDGFNDLSPGMKKFLVVTTAFAVALGPLAFVFGAFLRTLAFGVGVFKNLAVAIGHSKGALFGFGKGYPLLTQAVGGLSKVISGFLRLLVRIGPVSVGAAAGLLETGKAVRKLNADIDESKGLLSDWEVEALSLQKTFPRTTTVVKILGDAISEGARNFMELSGKNARANAARFQKGISDLKVKVNEFGGVATRVFPGMKVQLDGISNAVNAVATETRKASRTYDEHKKALSKAKIQAEALWNVLKGLTAGMSEGRKKGFLALSRAALGLHQSLVQPTKLVFVFNQGFKSLGELLPKAARSLRTIASTFKVMGFTLEAFKTAGGELSRLFQEWGFAWKDVPDDVNEFTEALDSLKKEIIDTQEAIQQGVIEQNIDDITESALEAGRAFSDIADIVEQELRNSFLLDIEPIVRETKDARIQVEQQVAAEARKLYREFSEEQIERQKEIAEEIAESQKKAHQEAVDFWSNAMENAITGATFDLQDSLKQVAIGFAAQMAAALIGAPGVSSLKGFGGLLANSLIGGGGNGGGIINSLLGSAGLSGIESLGLGSVFANGAPAAPELIGAVYTGGELLPAGGANTLGSVAAAQNPLLAAAAPAMLAGVAAVWGSALMDSTSGLFDSSGGNDAASGINTALMSNPITAPIGIISQLTGFDFGRSMGDSMAQARKGVESWIEENLANLRESGQGFQILGADGQLTDFGGDFIFGDRGRFEDASWADDFWSSFEGRGGGAFNAVGMGLAALTEQGSEIGGQLGLILAENLGTGELEQNLNNIGLFLQAMGISAEQMTQSLFEMAKAGEITFLEFESMRQSLEALPAEGLAAAGDFKTAMELLLQAGGKGARALSALHAVAIEAAEADIQTFDELRERLIEAGFEVKVVDALFAGMAQRGVNSMDDFRNASEVTLGQIIADMEAAGVVWDDYTEGINTSESAMESLSNVVDDKLVPAIERFADAVNGIPSSKTVTINQKFTSSGSNEFEDDPRFKLFARGGVVNGAMPFRYGGGSKLGLMGEAGPEAILPLVRTAKGLGVNATGLGGGVTYNIDARGAAPGVEQSILSALEDRAVSRSVSAVREEFRRSGR